MLRVQVQMQRHGCKRGSRVISDIKHEIACRIVRKSRRRNPSASPKSLKLRAVSALAFDFAIDTHQRRKNRQFNPISFVSCNHPRAYRSRFKKNGDTCEQVNPVHFFILYATLKLQLMQKIHKNMP